jgi:hypothetical protein
MINRLTHSTAAAAMELQNAAEARRNQAANAQTSQQTGAQYNFAEIFGGADWGETGKSTASSASPASSPGGFHTAIATATAKVVKNTGEAESLSTPASGIHTSLAAGSSATTTQASATQTAAATTATTAAADTTPAVTNPGVEALVTAIMNGSFQPTYVTDPSQLQETTPAGTDTMPNFYYASDQTAAQLASLLGGTVVQSTPFGQDQGWSEPLANFIQLPNGQTFNAADVAYYANAGSEGAAQLTADITATINQGSAWTQYYQSGGQMAMPIFAEGYVGPPISGMSYPTSMIGSDGNVINPAMQQSAVTGA